MSYVHEQIDYSATRSAAGLLARGLSDSQVMNALHDLGYTIYGYRTWWSLVDYAGFTVLPTSSRSVLLDELVQTTVRISALRVLENELGIEQMRSDILSILDDIRTTSTRTRPFLVFAHILCPHPPYVFRADGSRPSLIESALGRLESRDAYVAQLRFVSGAILQAIREAVSRDDPLIILQADHGSGLIFGNDLMDSASPSDAFLRAQFGILNALRIPQGLNVELYDNMSPVNTFRSVLNALYGRTAFPLLPDRSYFTKETEPWAFTDVTSVVSEDSAR